MESNEFFMFHRQIHLSTSTESTRWSSRSVRRAEKSVEKNVINSLFNFILAASVKLHKKKFYFLSCLNSFTFFSSLHERRLAGYVQVIKQFSHWKNVSWLIMPELVSFMKICERGDSKSSNCESRIADATCVRSTRVRWESKLDALTYKVSVDEFLRHRRLCFRIFAQLQTLIEILRVKKAHCGGNRWGSEVGNRTHADKLTFVDCTTSRHLTSPLSRCSVISGQLITKNSPE